jgi:hypothetical protein
MILGPPIRACAVMLVLLVGCRDGGRSLGNFEDDVGDTVGVPPDLFEPECLPRSVGFVGGCADDEKCGYVVDPELGSTGRCVPLVGQGVVGDPCTRVGESDTCGDGMLCWAVDPATDEGVCIEYCTAFLSCENTDKVCVVAEDGLLALCLDPCLPTVPDACPPGWGCYDSPAGRWGCDRDYSGAGGGHGSPCECVNCCDPGLICEPAGLVDAPDCMVEGAIGCCATVCELPDEGEAEPTCPSENESCEAYYGEQVLAGYEKVGVCRL